jgi:hypothetical protein
MSGTFPMEQTHLSRNAGDRINDFTNRAMAADAAGIFASFLAPPCLRAFTTQCEMWSFSNSRATARSGRVVAEI